MRFETQGDQTDLIVSPLDRLEEPPSLIQLREAVAARLPRVDLPEILLEIAARTQFTDAFTHLTERTARVEDLATSVCAVLLAGACNTGSGPLVRRDIPALKRDRLAWVDQNYVREDTLLTANATLVAAQSRIALAQAWGGGEVASADGLRFVVPVRTVHAGPNPKYFGTGRGVTWYNLVSDQFTGLVVNVIALWNTPYMEAVLAQLRQEGYPVRDEDVARLSPLLFEHINLLGRYSFTVPEVVIRGELRPLRDPAEEDA